MIFYYKMYLLDSDTLLGVVSSNEFRQYIRGHYYLANSPKDANCFVHENSFYRASWMTESDELKDLYPVVDLFIISQEEYEEYLKNRLEG